MIRYAITTGEMGAVEAAVQRWTRAGVDFVQLRDKTLDSGHLAARAHALLHALRDTKIQLLINGRVDIALAVGAAGVHLTSHPDELTAAQVRRLMPHAVVSVSCHTLAEVSRARDTSADFILFGPVFEKRAAGTVGVPGIGLSALQEAAGAAAPSRVLALGGVTEANATACLAADAAGIAGIRLFALQRL